MDRRLVDRLRCPVTGCARSLQAIESEMIGRWLMIAIHAPLYVGLRLLVRRALGRGPLPRGMSPWRDLLDWLGGYPFEVAKPEAVVAFCRARALSPVRVVTVGGRHGCNEFVFMRAGKGGT